MKVVKNLFGRGVVSPGAVEGRGGNKQASSPQSRAHRGSLSAVTTLNPEGLPVLNASNMVFVY